MSIQILITVLHKEQQEREMSDKMRNESQKKD